MKVLVTGAYGYFGSVLVPYLDAQGFAVTALGRAPKNPPMFNSSVTRLYSDLRHLTTDALQGCVGPSNSAVVHLAGGGGPAECVANPVEAIRTGLLGTQKLLSSVPGVPVVFASSICVYPPTASVCRENDATEPESIYGAVKEAAEGLVLQHSRSVVLRFANIFGPSHVPLTSVLDNWAEATRQYRPIQLHGAGTRVMNLVHIRDACRAVHASLISLNAPRRANSIFNVGSTVITTGQLAEACVRLGAGGIQRAPASLPGDDLVTRRMSISRIGRDVGWFPREDFNEALQAYVQGGP